MRALRGDDPDRYAFAVLNQVLGGGMSSRLFQEVREKRGLAYSVYAYRSAFDETGTFAISAGTAPDRLPELLEVIGTEIDRVIVDGGVGDDELMAAKGHLTGSLALSLETSGSRMHRIGSNELSLGEIATLDELVDRVNAVGPGDIARVVERVMAPPERSLAVVGPVKTAEVKALFN
jgi:predicted Zn-dependent peptidase